MATNKLVPNNSPVVPVMTSWARPANAPSREKEWDHPGGGELMTKQADALDTDVNVIVEKYGRTGQWAHVNPREPRYQDNTEWTGLMEAEMIVAEANREFMTLPANVRALAENKPAKLLEMLTDEGAVKMLVAAGLPIIEKPTPTEIPPAPAPAPAAPVAPGGGVS